MKGQQMEIRLALIVSVFMSFAGLGPLCAQRVYTGAKIGFSDASAAGGTNLIGGARALNVFPRTKNVTGREAVRTGVDAHGVDSINAIAGDNQEPGTNCNWWLDLGLGLGGWRTSIAGTTDLSVSLQDRSSLYTIRYNRVFDLHFLEAGARMSDYGILYGRIAKSRYSYVSISGGLGITSENGARLGIPLEADIYGTPIPWVGIGFKVCANISPGPGPTRNYWCVILGLQFGKLR